MYGTESDTTEDLSVHLLSQEEVRQLVLDNQMIQSLMIAPLLKYFLLGL